LNPTLNLRGVVPTLGNRSLVADGTKRVGSLKVNANKINSAHTLYICNPTVNNKVPNFDNIDPPDNNVEMLLNSMSCVTEI